MLTVLMATHNGSPTLGEVLTAYTRLRPPPGGWKLVAVDNDSRDGTRDLLLGFRDRLPIHYVFEPRRGQNAARNAGLAEIAGDLVVHTDDDVVPTAEWLCAIRTAADHHPDHAIIGGPILPRWERPPPEWVLRWVPLSPTFAIPSPLPEGPIPPRAVFSPNLTIRAEVFARGHRFDESIGPQGKDYAMGSETELLIRLDQAGFRAWYTPSAVVHHVIRSFQFNEQWVLGRAFRFGRGQFRLDLLTAARAPICVLGVPRYVLVHLAIETFRLAQARLRGRPDDAFRARWHLNWLRGQAREARLIREGRRPAVAVAGTNGRHP